MKAGHLGALGAVLCVCAGLSAMVIRDDTKKNEAVRTETGVFHEDYLYVGHELHFSGEAEDLVFAGKELVFGGKLQLGLLGVCEKLVFSGEAGNGITAGGFDIAVDGKITGNNYVASGTLHLGEAAVINGNLFAAGGKVLVDGTINGDLYAAAGQIVINSAINGNVVAYGGRVTIGEKGRIQGSLTYAAKEKLSSAELARVGGVTKVSEACKPKENNNFTTGLMIVFCLVVVLSTMIAGILLLFLPASEGLDATQTGRAFWITSLWGLIPILMYPAAVVLGFVLIVTIPVSLVLIFALIPLFFVANIIGTALLGKYIVRLFKWNVRRRHYQFLIGVAAAAILSLIPGVNFLTMLLLCSLGWGVYLSFLFKKDLAA